MNYSYTGNWQRGLYGYQKHSYEGFTERTETDHWPLVHKGEQNLWRLSICIFLRRLLRAPSWAEHPQSMFTPRVKIQVSHPYKTQIKIIVLYILISELYIGNW